MAISKDPPGYGQMSQVPLNSLPREVLEKMEYERRMKERMRAEALKSDMYRNLLDAWTQAPAHAGEMPTLDAEAKTLGEMIRRKIDEHKKMIATLEWFAAHVSLDNPEASTLVTRVVLEGLASIENRDRERNARWETR